MIGIGKWTGDIDTSVFKGSGIVEITDNNGEYDFTVTLDSGAKITSFKVTDIVEQGNCLSAKASSPAFHNIPVAVSVEFHGDTFEGNIKVPFLGNVPILNGRRVG